MSYTNHQTKEIHFKILYLGPRGSGKTQTLQAIWHRISWRGRSFSIPKTKPTDLFDFLPVSLGKVQGYQIRLHLFTLPSSHLYPVACNVMMQGVDGFIFVAHSSSSYIMKNRLSFNESEQLFLDHGYQMAEMPSAFQYNWLDGDYPLSQEKLAQIFSFPPYKEFLTKASEGIGTLETLQSVTKDILARVALHSFPSTGHDTL